MAERVLGYPKLRDLATRLAGPANFGTMDAESEKVVREVIAALTEMDDAYEGFTRRMGAPRRG